MYRIVRMIWFAVLAVPATACPGGKTTDKSAEQPQAARSVSGEAEQAKAAESLPGKQGESRSPSAEQPLFDPAGATARAPDKYTAALATGKGEILIDVERDWAPLGADRFYNLVKIGYYDDNAFFRVVEGFMAQAGINGDPRANQIWRTQSISDDPVKQSNTRGMVSFATSGRDSRSTQFFINFDDNSRLDAMGFAPFGKVRDMKPVDALYAGYGEGAPRGRGPVQRRIQTEGNAYLKAEFPELDYILKARIAE